jgi:hypothetical protein
MKCGSSRIVAAMQKLLSPGELGERSFVRSTGDPRETAVVPRKSASSLFGSRV